MGKLRESLASAGEKLKDIPKERQGKAFVRILQFFGIMFALTLFARGAAGVTMPMVETTLLLEQNILNSDEFTGMIAATNKEDIKMPEGLTVSKVLVTPGATVETGDELVKFDIETINTSLVTEEIALQEMRIALQELLKPRKQDDSAVKAAQDAQKAAQKAYDKAVSGAAYSEAQRAKDAAREAREDAKKNLKNKEKKYNDLNAIAPWAAGDPEPSPPPTGTSSPVYDTFLAYNAMVEAKGNLKTAEAAYQAAKAALESEKRTAEDGIPDLLEALNEANEALADAEKAYNEGKVSFGLEGQKNSLEVKKKNLEISKQREKIEKLQKLSNMDGVIKASKDGTITVVAPTAGAVTTAEDYVRISTGSEGYMAEFGVTQEQARKIKPGTSVMVTLGEYYWSVDAKVVGRGMPDDKGSISIKAQLASTDFSDGDSVTVKVIYSDQYYSSCVPLTAVRPDSNGQYVLVLSDESTTLGTQTVAHKVPVKITAQNNEYAAIDGIYEYDARIIIKSSKPVNDGDMVRLAEASTK